MQQGIKEKDIRDMQRCFEKMRSIMLRIQEYNPHAHIVIVESDLITLTGIEDFAVNNEVVAKEHIPKMDTVNMA